MHRADFILRDAGRLVTCDPSLGDGPLGVIERGALAARGGRVLWAGKESDITRSVEVLPDAAEVSAGGRAVIPGLIDCHTHLVFAGDRRSDFAARMRGEPYRSSGITATVEATRAATDEDLTASARKRLDAFLSFGVTTVEAKSGYGLTADQESRLIAIAAALNGDPGQEVVPTFLGAHVVPEEFSSDPDGYVKLVVEEMIPAVAGQAVFCDVWCDRGAFSLEQAKTVLEAAKAHRMHLKVHAEQIARTGAAVLAASLGAVSADHLEQATEEDARALADSGTVAVLLPGASMMTSGIFAPARMLIEAGARVALSTDFNPGTSYSENLPLVAALACAHLGMSPEEAILGITRHAAAALAREGEVGSIAPGARCDIAVLKTDHEIDLAYHYGVGLIAAVVRGGLVALRET